MSTICLTCTRPALTVTPTVQARMTVRWRGHSQPTTAALQVLSWIMELPITAASNWRRLVWLSEVTHGRKRPGAWVRLDLWWA